MIQQIKTYLWGNFSSILLALLLIISTFFAVHYYRKSQEPAKLIADQKILQHPGVAPIDSFTDKSGQKHTEIPADTHQVTQSSLKDTSVKRDSVIQKISQDLNLADPIHLVEVRQENLQLRAAVLRLRRDSTNKAILAYNDHAISFKYDPRDSTVRNLLINLKLTQVKYSKPKLFSNKAVIDFYADDPRVQFSGFNHFSVALPPPVFGLTTDAKASYLIKTGRIVPSIGIDLRVGNFHLEERNFYLQNQVQQMASFGYRQTIF
jgi:hypothetical protein